MTSDFAFWKHSTGHPEEVFDGLAEGETDALTSSPDVTAFRETLLTRWPDLRDDLEPSEHDREDPSKYVLLTLSARQLDYLPDVLALANTLGLVGYSGVTAEPI